MVRRAARAHPRGFARKTARRAPERCRKFVYNRGQMVRFLTAGESHGRALVVILEGIPAGLPLDLDAITAELRRRQGGYGRGRRMAIESDRADIVSGVRAGQTIGGPIAMLIENKDWPNWQFTMRTSVEAAPDAGGAHRAPVTRPRPGHADLAGVAKYGRDDVRDVLERASARETAARVAAGAVARQLLLTIGLRLTSHVCSIGDVGLPHDASVPFGRAAALAADAPLRCVDPDVEERMIAAIDRAREAGDTLGGAFEVIATGVPIGLGSYAQWDRKLDGRHRAGADVDPRHQGGGRWPRTARGVAARLAGARRNRPGRRAPQGDLAGASDEQRRRTRGRRHQRRGPARLRVDEADLDAHEAAAFGRSRRP